MSFDLDGWLSQWPKLVTVSVLTFTFARVSDVRKWWRDRKESKEKAALKVRLLAHAKEHEARCKALSDKRRALGPSRKNRTMYAQQYADGAQQAANAYREAGDVENALRCEHMARKAGSQVLRARARRRSA
jgi:hypothetical protein